METFPELITERLVLSQPQESDREDLISYLNETPEFSENTLSMPYPYLDEHATFWFEMSKNGLETGNAYIFAIRLKESKKLIGGIGLHLSQPHSKAEAGYWIAKDYQKKGYVTEALKEMIRFGLQELHLNKIYATCFVHNPASGKAMIKCGMRPEAELRQEYCKNGQFLDVFRYIILRENFQ